MSFLGKMLAPRVLAPVLVAFAALAGPVRVACAEPIVPVLATIPAVPLGSVDATLGAGTVSLTPDTFAIPVDHPYRFTARVRVTKGADSVMMRFQVLNPSGRLMIQKTQIQSDIETGQATAVFERETDDLGLAPGSYPVNLEVQVVRNGAVTEETLESELLVYQQKGRRVPVVFAVRVSSQPLSGPQGSFVADPGQFTRARDDARALAVWVIEQPDAQVTVSLSPLLLDEWKRISEGYVLTGPEGDTRVAADSAVPLAYGETLDRIKQAIGTGRFELALTGYTDPDLGLLSEQGLLEDVAEQYAHGTSAVYSSLESTPTTGTVVAGACIPAEAAGEIISAGAGYAIMNAECTRSGSTTASPGVYAVKDRDLIALVVDERATRAVERSDPESLVRRVFELRQAGSVAPVVIQTQVGPGHQTVASITSAVATVRAQPWARLTQGRTAAAKRPKRTLRLKDAPVSSNAPAGYWDDVRDGRRWADALAAALPDSPAAVTAERDSLIAECSAWAGPDGSWSLADRGKAFSSHAVTLAREVFDPIELDTAKVTLAGSSGEVPVTISNDGDLSLTLVLRCEPSRGLQVEGDDSRSVEVLPKDNFIQIPVSMQNALTGRLTVKLVSGDTVIDEQTVGVTASYLDRLVMISGVVVVLGVMLAYVIRRVRAAERAEEDAPQPEE